MPIAALKPCRHPGCGQLVESGYCERHRKTQRPRDDQQRGSSTERGYDYRWQKARDQFLREHPLCQCPECKEGELRLLPSSVVDHKVPHKGDMKLFWDRSNWQAMSKPCHDKKTAREDGGFGRGRGVQIPGAQKS
jgi:5-methylcytosine-specific restriction protein A